jgi:hypothetical protein
VKYLLASNAATGLLAGKASLTKHMEFDQDDSRQAGAIRAALTMAGTPIGPYNVLMPARRRRATSP